ncbi:Protein Y37A1B.7 [Aphelenchoides avenae]|nr:Protein Y37A1B.7 [Aphelenchus avenae]
MIHLAAGSHRENHFGNPCTLCECFIEYTDRDVALPSVPYKVAAKPYDITEDKCLSLCMDDSDCKVAVYGYVGGRNIFACELYDEINARSPIYTPFTNMYIKRVTKCAKKAPRYFPPLQTVEGDESTVARKSRYLKLQQKLNPFNFG